MPRKVTILYQRINELKNIEICISTESALRIPILLKNLSQQNHYITFKGYPAWNISQYTTHIHLLHIL